MYFIRWPHYGLNWLGAVDQTLRNKLSVSWWGQGSRSVWGLQVAALWIFWPIYLGWPPPCWGLDEGTCIGNRNSHKSEQGKHPQVLGAEALGELAGNPQPWGLPSERGWMFGHWEVSPEHVVPGPWLQHPGASTLAAVEGWRSPSCPRYSCWSPGWSSKARHPPVPGPKTQKRKSVSGIIGTCGFYIPTHGDASSQTWDWR